MPAPGTAGDFLDLVQKSGVVDNERLSAYLAKLRAAGAVPPEEPAEFASLLIRDGILTFFQAEQILQGRWRRFTIGPYKVLERLGAGTQASVYLCQHTGLQRRVAVKVLPASSNNDPVCVQRFVHECRILAGLDHSNIVRVYELGQEDTLHYMVMEYVDGSSLQDITEKCGPMAVNRAAHYMRQAALGLQHAHERAGIVHRDIKPADILVDRGGNVKIIDMGLARFSRDEEAAVTTRRDKIVLGTPDYMAPEQAIDPQGVDIRADIYSLGATFYFCLTRYTPFRGGTAAQTLIWQQTRQPEPLRQLRRRIPEGLAALIERMLAKDPAQRPPTPQQVVDALARTQRSRSARPPKPRCPASA